MRTTTAAAWVCLSAILAFAGLGAGAQEAERLTGGNGTLYIGVYPNRLLVIDEATEKVSGEITMQSKYAPGRTVISHDHTRFYTISIDLENIEVLDVASRRSIDVFKLSEGRRRVRVRSLAADPLDRFLVLLAKTAEKRDDYFAIGPTQLLVYDLAAHKVTQTVPWPDNDERENASLMFSPDGKFLYLFGRDVVVYDTSSFKAVDTWKLSQPLEAGMGRIEFAAVDTTFEEPGFYTALFTANDPVQNRPMMGVARVDLSARTLDFYTLGPSVNVSFSLAPGRTRAYGLYQEIGRYELWTFDLEARRIASRVEFKGRPRMALRTSTNGRLLYIYLAGNTIDVYEAATFKYLRTIDLGADSTTPLFVVPAG